MPRADRRTWARTCQILAAVLWICVASACDESPSASRGDGSAADAQAMTDALQPDQGPTPDSGTQPPPDGAASDGPSVDSVPSGSPQYPALLSGYIATPGWPVAGVDFPVGVPQGMQLQSPTSISVAGVQVNASTRVVTITVPNVTLDGYDFSHDGGWGIEVQADSARIVNSSFVVGSNGHKPIHTSTAGSNLYVRHCTLDGSNHPDPSALIEVLGSTATVEHCWLKNAGGDIIQLHSGGGTVTIRYNLVENAGMAPGAHGDYTEFIGGPFAVIIQHNTTRQSGGTTQGFMVEPDLGSAPGVITSGDIGFNTFTAQVGLSYFTAVTSPDIVNLFTVHDNYFDSTHVYGFAIGGIRGGPDDAYPETVYTHNVNMISGALVEDTSPP